jgi:hypothetical protein
LEGVEWRDHDASKGERRDHEPRGGRERWGDGMVKIGRSRVEVVGGGTAVLVKGERRDH